MSNLRPPAAPAEPNRRTFLLQALASATVGPATFAATVTAVVVATPSPVLSLTRGAARLLAYTGAGLLPPPGSPVRSSQGRNPQTSAAAPSEPQP